MTISTLMNHRWLRVSLLAVLVVVVILMTLAYTMVDSRKVAHLAANIVEQKTGRSLTLNGPVSLRLFPHPSVIAEDVVLGNASWAVDPVMLKADRIEFAAQWLPLLRQQFVIDHVHLRGMTLNLQAAPATQKVAGNWVLTAQEDTPPIATKGDTDSELFNLKSVQLSAVSINLKDASGAQIQSVDVDQLAGSLSDTQLDFSGGIRWQKQPLNIKGLVQFQPNSPLNITLGMQAERLSLQPGAGTSKPSASTAQQGWLFGTSPLGFDALPLVNGVVDVAIKTLVLPSGVVLPDLSTRISLNVESAGVLHVEHFKAGLGQGTLQADGRITGYTARTPQISLRGAAKDFTLDQVIAQANPGKTSNLIQGGPAQAAFNLSAMGRSPRELASTVNGQVQLSVGSATVNSALFDNGGDFVLSLLDAVNPLRKRSEENQLQCFVAYLPVRNGLVSIAQSIGIETDRLNVILDGQVNLKNERLNVRIYPTEKTGLTTGVSAAGMVQINGTLLNPTLGVNKTGVVKQAANVGLAVITAGISLAAQNVAGMISKSSPCQNVLRPWSSVDGQMSSR